MFDTTIRTSILNVARMERDQNLLSVSSIETTIMESIAARLTGVMNGLDRTD
jgi:hypothetical protein